MCNRISEELGMIGYVFISDENMFKDTFMPYLQALRLLIDWGDGSLKFA